MVPSVGRPGDQYLYRMTTINLYSQDMDVGITELRANLAEWVRRAADGEEIVITDRGRPVARIVPPDPAAARMSELVAAGIVTPPSRRKSRRPSADYPRVRALPGETLADTVIRLREERGC